MAVAAPQAAAALCTAAVPEEEEGRRREEEEEKEERRIGARGGVKQTAAQTYLSPRHVKQTGAQT